MPTDDPSSSSQPPSLNEGFRLSGGPVAYLSEEHEGESDFVELSQLPRIYGEPILFAIARDPRTVDAATDDGEVEVSHCGAAQVFARFLA